MIFFVGRSAFGQTIAVTFLSCIRGEKSGRPPSSLVLTLLQFGTSRVSLIFCVECVGSVYIERHVLE